MRQLESFERNLNLMRMSYWLVPEEVCILELQSIVSRLAKEFNGPQFIPHITLYSGEFTENDSTDHVLNRLNQLSALTLTFRELKFEPTLKRSCILVFDPEAQIFEMNSLLRSSHYLPDLRDVSPHLSLFYGELNLEQQNIVRQMLPKFGQVKFDRVIAVANEVQVVQAEDVGRVIEVGRVPLENR